MTVEERIEGLKSEARAAVAGAGSAADLERVRVHYLGRSAEITGIKKSIGSLAPESRREVGGAANLASHEIESALGSRMGELVAAERESRLRAEAVDVTLPGVTFPK